MPATSYKVWQWGTPVGQGVTGANHVAIAGIAKKSTATDPYLVANEIICNSLARMLLLPCPPGALLDKSGDTYFFSLDFNLAGQSLPPVDPAVIIGSHLSLSWGIILFDNLVMNFDRHEMNIAHDLTTNRIQIFDHSHAFLHAGNNNVPDVLSAHDGGLCIGGHCLANEIDSYDGLDEWDERIRQIPDFFIEGVIGAASGIGIPANYRSDCIDFMKKRRSEVGDIVKRNVTSDPSVFPKLPRVS